MKEGGRLAGFVAPASRRRFFLAQNYEKNRRRDAGATKA